MPPFTKQCAGSQAQRDSEGIIMKVTFRAGTDMTDRIPSAIADDVYYSKEEIDSSTFISEADDTGDTVLLFPDGHFDTVYSFDLDFIPEETDLELEISWSVFARNDLIAKVPCLCNQIHSIWGYRDEFFWSAVNREPREIKLECGQMAWVRWLRTGDVNVKFIVPNVTPEQDCITEPQNKLGNQESKNV